MHVDCKYKRGGGNSEILYVCRVGAERIKPSEPNISSRVSFFPKKTSEKIFIESLGFFFVSLRLRISANTEEKWLSWIYDALRSTV